MVIWGRNDYLMEAEKQLSDKNVNKEVNFDGKLIQDLTETSNKIFRNLKKRGFIADKELKYFRFDYKRAWKNCTFFLQFMKGFLMYLVNQCF